MKVGTWIERLDAIAVGREVVAVAGKRDAVGVFTSRVHVLPVSLLDDKGAAWALDATSPVLALAFAGDELLLAGGDDGTLVAWDVTGKRKLAELGLGASVRALATDAAVARGDAGTVVAGTADGAIHLLALTIQSGAPRLASVVRHAVSDGPIQAIAADPAGVWVCGGADGQLRIATKDAVRAVAPGGDGGIRAVACVGDGRAVIGCGDGSIRLAFIVGDVEAHDRSGDHGHDAAVTGLALGPTIVDEAGREQPRRLFSVGDDGALKCWFVDGARRPKTIELGIGPAAALALAPGPVPKLDRAVGRLWISGTHRKVCALSLDAEVEPHGNPIAIGGILDGYEASLRDAKAAVKVKMEIVNQLAELAEDEARVLLDYALGNGPPEVRIAATQAMTRSQRRASRPALRAALSATQPELRGAAFHALRELEHDQPIAAIRAGFASSFDDVRVRAVEALIPLARTSVIAAGLIADALRDSHPNVRRRAFAALCDVAPDASAAVRTALARGTADVRAEALLYLALKVRATDAGSRRLIADAFDDDDAGVRTSAFFAALGQRPALLARVAARVPSISADLATLSRQLGFSIAIPADDGAALDDEQLEPLFAQLACRHADAAIRGAGCLLALGDPRAIGAVLQLTREADPALRRGATANLVLAIAQDPNDDRLTTRLSWLLDDPDRDVRNYAFDALATAATKAPAAPAPAASEDDFSDVAVAVGTKAAALPPSGGAATATAELDLAELGLRTSQEDIRVRALQILVRTGAPASGSTVHERASALLGDALDDEAQKVRSEAFRTLWTWHAQDPMVPLARGATSRHADLRTQVVAEIERRRQAKQATPDMDRLLRTLVADPVAAVGLAAYRAFEQPLQADGTPATRPPEVHLAALESPSAQVRAAGCAGCHQAPAASVRARLVELVKDDNPRVHDAAIDALDEVAPGDPEGFALAFGSIFYELQVHACELCGKRRDPKGIAPAQRLLSIPKTDQARPADVFRQRAARALADIGAAATLAFLQGLIDDEDPIVREMGARGIATAATAGNAKALAALLGLLGHDDLPVRSWGAEGLAKLGDLRALPVLAGTQRHDHRPIRIGAIQGFVALGPEGVRGLRQGLEDRDREIQDLAFAVIVARDAALAQAGIAPDLVVDAMSSPSPEIRFAAARVFERRAAGEQLSADVIGELIGPRLPEKAADKKHWPAPERRAALLQVLASAIASADSSQRYAAAQVLAVRTQPLTFWREAARLSGPAKAAPVPHTGWSSELRTARRSGWLRRLVSEKRDPEVTELEQLLTAFTRAGEPTSGGEAAAQRLVFGVYAGLVRQAPRPGEADETHRVRRDAIGRLVELAREDAVGADAVLPVLAHAVGDPHHLVRGAAMTALRSLYPIGALAPLGMAIGGAADLGKAALDELVELAIEGDDRAATLVRSALDADDPEVRAYAALRLPKLYPAGSAEPQLLAATSRHGDVRLAAVTQLATTAEPSPTIIEALAAALGSEHADLRLRAAVALAKAGDARGVEVLGAFLKSEEHTGKALEALIGLAGNAETAAAAAEVIASRLDDDPDRTANRHALLGALGTLGQPRGATSIVRLLTDVASGKEGEVAMIATPAIIALRAILRDRTSRPRVLPDGRTRIRYRDALAVEHLAEAAKSPLPAVRMDVAITLGDVDELRRAEDTLAKLVGDRVDTVRIAAAEALALRAEYVPGATLVALEAALRGGRRELVLPAALGLAARSRPEAFQPLLLVIKAGEPPERERALLAFGSLGDRRALAQILPILEPAPDDEASRVLTHVAAEALGRLIRSLTGDEATESRERVLRLALGGAGEIRLRALTGLRYAGDLGTLRMVAADREARSDVRIHAIAQLGLAGSDGGAASEPVLAELLSDDDYSIRVAAFRALGKVLGGDRTRLSLHALGSPHDDISSPAASYLALQGDPAILVARLGSVKNPETRRMLREGLIRRGALPVPELAAALAGSDASARAEAAWIAGNAGDAAKPLAAALAQSVTRSSAQVAAHKATPNAPAMTAELDAWWAAAWAARRVDAASGAEPAALAALADDRMAPRLRREATATLAASGSANAVTALVNSLGDVDREVRAIAAHAVALRQPASAPRAVRALGSRADATTIAPLAWAAWPELAPGLIGDTATRSWAIAASLAGARIDELLAIAQGHGETATRIAAIGALCRFDDLRVLQALETIHNDDSAPDEIKLAAWKAIKRILRRTSKTYAEGQDKGGAKPAAGGGGGDDGDDDGDGDEDEDEDEDGGDDGDDDEDGGDDGEDDDGDDGDDDDGDDDDGGDDDEEDDDDDD